MKKENIANELKTKLEYIGLDLENIPETLKIVEEIKYKPAVGIDEKKYKQYKFVPIKEIEILLSPTNRLDETKEKYRQLHHYGNSFHSFFTLDLSRLHDFNEFLKKGIRNQYRFSV